MLVQFKNIKNVSSYGWMHFAYWVLVEVETLHLLSINVMDVLRLETMKNYCIQKNNSDFNFQIFSTFDVNMIITSIYIL